MPTASTVSTSGYSTPHLSEVIQEKSTITKSTPTKEQENRTPFTAVNSTTTSVVSHTSCNPNDAGVNILAEEISDSVPPDGTKATATDKEQQRLRALENSDFSCPVEKEGCQIPTNIITRPPTSNDGRCRLALDTVFGFFWRNASGRGMLFLTHYPRTVIYVLCFQRKSSPI